VYEKPEGLYRMTRGIAVHEYLSRGSGGLKECRLSWTFRFRGAIVTLTGMPDLVELRPEGLFVTDLNLTGADFSAVKKTKKRVCAASPHILIIRTLSAERAGGLCRPLSH
jgi:hypothetical protein